MSTYSRKKGFTIIEILLVVGLFGFLIGISIPVYSGFVDRANISNTSDLTQAALIRARKYAQIQKNNSSWGVRYQPGQIIVFAGESYDTRDTTLDEVTQIPDVISLDVTSNQEVVFEQVSGRPLTNGARFELLTPLETSNTITIDPDGEIKRQDLNTVQSNTPSSISDLAVWLRADTNVSTVSGNQVESWASFSGPFHSFAAPTSSQRPTLITGALNGEDAISFDGVDDWLESSSVFPTSSSFSVAIVTQITDPTTDGVIIGGNGSGYYSLRFDDNRGPGRLFFALDVVSAQDPVVFSSNITPANEWRVIFLTYDNSTKQVKLYENNRLSSTGNAHPTTNPVDSDLKIGANNTDLNRVLDGLVAEIAVFSKVLTGEERQGLHQYIEDRYDLILY